MTGIQLILVTGFLFIGLYLLVRWKKKSLDIILLALMVFSAIIFVIWPQTTQYIADQLGVGRGADLVFYLSILIFWFVILKMYARIRKLEQIVTEAIRKDALDKARDRGGS